MSPLERTQNQKGHKTIGSNIRETTTRRRRENGRTALPVVSRSDTTYTIMNVPNAKHINIVPLDRASVCPSDRRCPSPGSRCSPGCWPGRNPETCSGPGCRVRNGPFRSAPSRDANTDRNGAGGRTDGDNDRIRRKNQNHSDRPSESEKPFRPPDDETERRRWICGEVRSGIYKEIMFWMSGSLGVRTGDSEKPVETRDGVRRK